MLITAKNKKLIFHLQTNVEYVMVMEQNLDPNLFLVLLVMDMVRFGQVKVFLQFNQLAQIAVVKVNKFQVLARNVVV